MATLLADWDAESVTVFVAKMNTVATKLGLSSTHITDPSGVDPATRTAPKISSGSVRPPCRSRFCDRWCHWVRRACR